MEDRWLYGWTLGYVAVGAASLLIPLYALALGGGPLLVGVLASTAAFAGVPGALLWGRLAARTERRRPFVLVALGSTAAVLAATPLVRSPWPLVAANAALWFVVAAAAPVLNLVMVDGVPEDRWAARLGLLQTYQGYGWVAGLVVGAAWTAAAPSVLDPVFAQELLFGLLAATSAAGFLLVRLWYPDPASVSERRFRRVYRGLDVGPTVGRVVRWVPFGPGRAYWALTGLRPDHLRHLRTPLWRYLAAVGLFMVGSATFWAPMPAYLTAAGFATGPVFVLFLLSTVGSTVCFGRVDAVAARLGTTGAQIGALAVRAVLFPAVAVVGGWAVGVRAPLVGALFFGVGVTWAVVAVTATALVARLAPAADRAEALGLYAAVAGVGTGLGSVAGGALAARTGYGVTFGVAGAVVLLGTVLVAAGTQDVPGTATGVGDTET